MQMSHNVDYVNFKIGEWDVWFSLATGFPA